METPGKHNQPVVELALTQILIKEHVTFALNSAFVQILAFQLIISLPTTREVEANSTETVTKFQMASNQSGEATSRSTESYLQRFSSAKWSDLSNAEKKRNRLGNCSRCWELHQQYQQCFPLKPIYQPTPAISIDRNVLRQQGIKSLPPKLYLSLILFRKRRCSGGFKGGFLGFHGTPFGLDLVQRSTGDRLNGSPCLGEELRKSASMAHLNPFVFD